MSDTNTKTQPAKEHHSRRPRKKLEFKVNSACNLHYEVAIHQDSREDKIKFLRAALDGVWSTCEMFSGISFFDLLTDDERRMWADHLLPNATMLSSAATALNVDPVELAKALDLAGMIEALRRMDSLVESLWKSVDWGRTHNLDIAALNEAPLAAKRILSKLPKGR